MLLALFVRFVDPEAPSRTPRRLVASPEDLQLVRYHHLAFYALLVIAPCEWLFDGRPARWQQAVGAALAFAGVAGYRRAGGVLGAQLSPLVAPNEPAVLVDRDCYRRVRHPMYLSELAIAAGVVLLLHADAAWIACALFAVVVQRRIAVEERALVERLPAYAAYAARTYRLIPYVY